MEPCLRLRSGSSITWFSIQEVRKGYLGVTEYRNGGGARDDFPGGVVTNGLPALASIFHPYYAPNYEMTCEGLSLV